jgi:hypothetical protein
VGAGDSRPSRFPKEHLHELELVTRSDYSPLLPFEALFAARDALFGPIPVAQVEEVVRHTT